MIQKCGCFRADAIPQAPRLNRYQSVAPGEEIYMDIYYPLSGEKEDARNRPAILRICVFSRFVMSRFLLNVRPQAVVSCLLNHWIPSMGAPNRIMVGHGASFQGPDWSALSEIYGLSIVTAPRKAHYQIGIAERTLGLIKASFLAGWRKNIHGWSKKDLLSLTVLARNLSPSSNHGMYPLQIATGRGDCVGRLCLIRPPSKLHSESTEDKIAVNMWNRVRTLMDLRQTVIKLGNDQTPKLALSKNLRTGASTVLKHGQKVQIWLPEKEKMERDISFYFRQWS